MTTEIANTEHPGIKPEMKAEWLKFVDDAISNDEGEARNYALLILAQVSSMIKGLDEGLAPHDVLKLVQPNTSFIMMSPILQAVCAFSVRGEEFRLFWNAWHDRVSPGDMSETPIEDMTPIQRAEWEARPKPIFNPWQINIMGRVAQLTGAFDPSEPLTKSPKYLENVNAMAKKMREDAKPAGAAKA